MVIEGKNEEYARLSIYPRAVPSPHPQLGHTLSTVGLEAVSEIVQYHCHGFPGPSRFDAKIPRSGAGFHEERIG